MIGNAMVVLIIVGVKLYPTIPCDGKFIGMFSIGFKICCCVRFGVCITTGGGGGVGVASSVVFFFFLNFFKLGVSVPDNAGLRDTSILSGEIVDPSSPPFEKEKRLLDFCFYFFHDNLHVELNVFLRSFDQLIHCCTVNNERMLLDTVISNMNYIDDSECLLSMQNQLDKMDKQNVLRGKLPVV